MKSRERSAISWLEDENVTSQMNGWVITEGQLLITHQLRVSPTRLLSQESLLRPALPAPQEHTANFYSNTQIKLIKARTPN